MAGIKTANIRMGTFIIMGMFGSISGVVLASRLAHARAFVGSSLLFDSLTVVILAGTDINGGKGSIPRTIVGVLVIGLVGNIFLLAGMGYEVQQLAKGLILIAAILINIFYRKD